MNLSDLIIQYRGSKGLNQTEFADFLTENGIKTSFRSVQRYESGEMPPYAKKAAIVELIESDTPKFGAIEKHLNSYQKPDRLSDISPLSVEYFDFLPDSGMAQLPIVQKVEEVVMLPILDMEMSAGVGIEKSNVAIIGGMSFVSRWLRNDVGINPKKGFIAYVRGRSMEKYLFDKDLVLCEWTECMDGEDIYCVSYEGALLVKHLQIKGKDLMLVSENEIYKPVKVEGDNFKILGRVVRRITK